MAHSAIEPGQPKDQSDEDSAPQASSVKRRALFASIWAAVAGLVLHKTTAPVEAAQRNLIYEGDVNAIKYLNNPRSPISILSTADLQTTPFDRRALEILVSHSEVTGMYAQSTTAPAMHARSSGGGSPMYAEVPGTASANAIAVYGLNNSSYAGPSAGAGGFGVYGLSAKGHGLVGATASAGGAAVVGATNGVAGAYAGAFYGPVIIGGDFTVVGGAKSAAVAHPDGSHRLLYCVESPESWFEDFGEGVLTNGAAVVAIDPDFAAVADTSKYHVFLTQYDDMQVMCVTDRTPAGFRVRASDAGACGAFSWRLVAKRKDIAGSRLASIDIPKAPDLPPLPAEHTPTEIPPPGTKVMRRGSRS